MGGEVNIEDFKYPKLLRNIPNPPKRIFFKGKLDSKIFENCLAVVGSRKMSFYGKKATKEILSTVSSEVTVVSGFMYGIDAEAHRQAIKLGLKTIAVMPCGIDYIHPEDQRDLYNDILSSGGLIISELGGDTLPKVWTYPRRNRIVAGISKAVLVVEAAIKSGSLITARIGHSFGRPVFVVPGSIFSSLSAGKIQISNEFAKSIDSGFQINAELGLGSTKSVSNNSEREDENNAIINSLNDGPMTIDDLSKHLSMNVSELSTQLTLLSMDGKVSEQGGKFYSS